MPFCPQCAEPLSFGTCTKCEPLASDRLAKLELHDDSDKLVRQLAKNIEHSEWHYSEGEETYGPVSISILRDLFTTGMVDEDVTVWTEAMGEGADWLSLSDPKNAAVLALLKGPTAEDANAPKPSHAPGAADICAGCCGILDSAERDVFGALGKLWHSGCFKCSGCDKPIADGSFIPHDGKAYHKPCHLKLFGTRCAGCNEPIEGGCLIIEDKRFHTGCFACADCGGSLKDGYALGPVSGRPFCAKHIKAAKAREAGSAAPALSAAVARVVEKEIAAAQGDLTTGRIRRGSLDGDGEDPITIDTRTGEEVYIERESGRKYQLDPSGNKVYRAEREKPRYGGATTWRTDGQAAHAA